VAHGPSAIFFEPLFLGGARPHALTMGATLCAMFTAHGSVKT